MPFANRPDFADPYPEGLAVGRVDSVGDASGGNVSMTLLSDGGFLFRPELINFTRGDVIDDDVSMIISHRWAADRSPVIPPTGMDLNWGMARDGLGTFSIYRMNADVMEMLRRFPLGRTDNVALQIVFNIIIPTNTLAITYTLNVVCSYWPMSALQRPGFLAAFYEAPVVPRVIP